MINFTFLSINFTYMACRLNLQHSLLLLIDLLRLRNEFWWFLGEGCFEGSGVWKSQPPPLPLYTLTPDPQWLHLPLLISTCDQRQVCRRHNQGLWGWGRCWWCVPFCSSCSVLGKDIDLWCVCRVDMCCTWLTLKCLCWLLPMSLRWIGIQWGFCWPLLPSHRWLDVG